jgi:hypothetical protein
VTIIAIPLISFIDAFAAVKRASVCAGWGQGKCATLYRHPGFAVQCSTTSIFSHARAKSSEVHSAARLNSDRLRSAWAAPADAAQLCSYGL